MTLPVFIFVYGSLRRDSGHTMSRWLAERAEWQACAWVPGRLYRVSDYPALAAGDGRVQGDLYRLQRPGETLSMLDAYEGIQGRPDDEYERRLMTVTPAGSASLDAWVYCYRQPVHELAWIESGDWLRALADQLPKKT